MATLKRVAHVGFVCLLLCYSSLARVYAERTKRSLHLVHAILYCNELGSHTHEREASVFILVDVVTAERGVHHDMALGHFHHP